jgi:hypothetical protein
MNTITEIIEKSRDIIRVEMKNNYLALALAVEDFLIRERVPVEEDYSDNEPYKYVCYPDTNFLEIINKVKSDLIPTLTGISDKEYLFKPFIFKYMMILSVDNKALLQVTNVFYPIANYKFRVQTYLNASRFADSKNKLHYIHPKYRLDHVLSQFYDPFSNAEAVEEEYYKIYTQWGELDGNKSVARRDKNNKRMGIREYELIKDIAVLCNHDLIYTSCLCREDDIDAIISKIDPKRKYTVVKNNVKSLYDIRYYNTTFSIGGKTVLKLWPVLQYQLIPVVSGNRAHINTVIHYALIDYLHYDILGVQKVAFFKNLILNYYINRRAAMVKNHILTRLDKCEYIGTYYPTELYLKQHRIDKIAEMIENKQQHSETKVIAQFGMHTKPYLLTL